MGTFNVYPEFVADQVLTADHLNELFDYLDEQDRLTRRCLIGIGIVCGLEVTYSVANILISRGIGVTSKGYLVEFPGGTYTHYRKYTLPLPPETPPPPESIINPFPYNTFTMYELLPAAEAGDTPISTSAAFLDEYVVALFFEIKATNLKNCTTNDCDDKGRDITITIKPLLIKKTDLTNATFICGDGTDPNLSAGTIEAGKALLPEVVLKRYNIPRTPLTSSLKVLQAFHAITSNTAQADIVGAYNKTYDTFKGLLGIGANPFSTLNSTLSVLFTQVKGAGIMFSQYFYDFLDDLIKAYNELRNEGNAIITACGPCDKLFPYHLALGEANRNSKDAPSVYRNYFIYSPLFGDQKNRLGVLRLLFQRMEELVKGFDMNKVMDAYKVPVRITPSAWSRTALSKRAIPFYYKPAPLFEKWNYEKTRYGKQKTNLSYSSDAWNVSPVLDFVKKPLEYELEPFTFFRIEGHIGKTYTTALAEIQNLKDQYSLPFDIVVVKAGAYKATDVDLSKYTCQLNDLEIAYDIARREWEAIIGQTIEWLDDHRTAAARYVSPPKNRLAIYIGNLHKAKTFMVDDLPAFIDKYADFMPLYEWIEKESEDIRIVLTALLENTSPTAGVDTVFVEDLIDHFDEVMMSVKKGPFRALKQAFNQRLEKIYAGQFLDNYAQKHPGLDHKAGVPRGGTFVLVYKYEKGTTEGLNAPEGAVIADFYLPYLCCSDCPPVSYVIQEVKPDPVRPTVDIVPKEFCNNDNKSYDVVASPAGGTLTGTGVVAGQFKFSPQNLAPGEYLLTYTIDGQSVNVAVKVTAPGSADFTINATEQPDHSFLLKLSPAVTNGTKYEWLVDGVLEYTTMLVEDTITFPEKSKTFKFTLRAGFGPCAPTESSKEITLTKKDDVQNIKRTECFKEKIVLEQLPAGSKLEIQDAGGLHIENGVILIKPEELPETKTFVIAYRITDNLGNVTIKTVELTIVVVKPLFNMKFEKEAPGLPPRYVLTALNPDLTFAQWDLIVDGAIKVTLNGSPASLSRQFTDIQRGQLVLTIRTKTGEKECTGKLTIDVDQPLFRKVEQSPNGINFPN